MTKSKSGRVLDDIEPATSELSWGKHSGTQWLDRMCHVNIIWTCIKYTLCQKKNNVWKTINNHQPSVFLFSSMPPISVFHRSSPPCSWETRRFGLSFPGPGCHAKHRAEVSQRNMVTWCIPSSFNPFQASFGIKHGSNISPREFQALVTPLVMEKSRMPSLSSLDAAGLTAQFSLLTHWTGTQTNPKIMIVHLIPMYSSWLYPQFLLVTASS